MKLYEQILEHITKYPNPDPDFAKDSHELLLMAARAQHLLDAQRPLDGILTILKGVVLQGMVANKPARSVLAEMIAELDKLNRPSTLEDIRKRARKWQKL